MCAREKSVTRMMTDNDDDNFYRDKLRTAQFYFSTEMPKVNYLATVIRDSANLVAAADAKLFTVA